MNEQLAGFLEQQELQLRKMDNDHYTDMFDCGRDAAMNKWLCNTAMKWQDENMCTVWVLSPLDNNTVVHGFFTLSSHRIIPTNVNKRDRAAQQENKQWVNALDKAYPAQLLGKFALDKDKQGKHLGQVLMLCVFVKHLEVADVTGAKFLVVDVQNSALIRYYKDNFGFTPSGQADMVQMYLSTKAIGEDVAQALII